MTVDHCSLWPDRLLGLDWSQCCEIHDASRLDLNAHLALGRCVAATGWTGMGVVMAAGVILFGRIYGRFKSRR